MKTFRRLLHPLAAASAFALAVVAQPVAAGASPDHADAASMRAGVSPAQLVVTTFGAPAVGNAAFAERYEGRFTLHRVVMSGDPMKDVLAAPLGFQQFGERVPWSPARSVAKFPHAMIVYVDAAIRQLYDAYGGAGAYLFLMGRPNRMEGRTLYVLPMETELDETLAADAPYMAAVLRDALHVQNASVVFAAGGLSADGLLSGHLEAARAAGAEQMVAYRIAGAKERTAHETHRLTLERAVYDMDGNLLAAGARSARTGMLTPIETVLYLFSQD